MKIKALITLHVDGKSILPGKSGQSHEFYP